MGALLQNFENRLNALERRGNQNPRVVGPMISVATFSALGDANTPIYAQDTGLVHHLGVTYTLADWNIQLHIKSVPLAVNWGILADTNYSTQITVTRLRNIVLMHGLVQNNTGAAATGTVATVPAEFRPLRRRHLGLTDSSAGPTRIDVFTTGDVVVYATIPAAGWVSLAQAWMIDAP